MKVWELIEALADVDKDAEVVITSDHPASEGCEYVVASVEQYDMNWRRAHVHSRFQDPDTFPDFLHREGSAYGSIHERLDRPPVTVVCLDAKGTIEDAYRPPRDV